LRVGRSSAGIGLGEKIKKKKITLGWNSNSGIWVGKSDKPLTGIAIPTHSCVCLDVNIHTRTLDYFRNDKHIKDCVVNIPKDVYFGV
jgi:hypothetical protein